MGLVINPRGTSGAGKTWLVREVMAAYRRNGAEASPLRRDGRARPMGWFLPHPRSGRPLAVIGHYEVTRGGTDTIPEADGGLDEAVRMTGNLACNGHDVLLEGFQLSGDVERTAALAWEQQKQGSRLHVLCLDTPLEQCVRNVVARRRAGRAERPAIERTVHAGHAAMIAACEVLRCGDAEVEVLGTTAALRRTLALLGLDPVRVDGETKAWTGGPSTSMSRAISPCQGLLAGNF